MLRLLSNIFNFAVSSIIVLCPFVALAEVQSTGPSEVRFVHDEVDFHQHTRLHAQRVQQLGLALRDQFYPDLNRQLTADFLALHDQSKLGQSSEANSILKRLFKFYGRSSSSLSPAERQEFQKLSQEIEQIDRATFHRFVNSRLSKQSADYDWILQALLRIEKLADMIDRSNDPIAQEEFGRNMAPVGSILTLSSEEMKMVDYLEENYKRIYIETTLTTNPICQDLLVQGEPRTIRLN